jgi:hypothetical protein
VTKTHLPATVLPERSVRSIWLRLLPWKPRWRVRTPDTDRSSALDWLDVDFEDPISAVLSLFILLLLFPVLLALLVGVTVLSLEMLLLVPLGLLLMTGQLLCLRPWILMVRYTDGTREAVEVRGLHAMVRRWRELRA